MWNGFSESSYFPFFPSKNIVIVDTGLSIAAACGRSCVAIPKIVLARRLLQLFASVFCFLGVCSTIGNLFPCDTLVDRF